MGEMTSSLKSAGWHGKLPTVGDFATRRLDPDFVTVWDEWLSNGLAKFRASNESQWLDDYLASPTWRFLLTPGFLPPPHHAQAWAGIVMPSVDRVGRYYPLTIAAPLANLPQAASSQAALWTWLHRVDDAAVDALQDDWSIDALEDELARIGLPNGTGVGVGDTVAVDAQPPALAARFFSVCASGGSADGMANGKGRCVWYSEFDLLAPRQFQCENRDDSIIGLWRF